ncbi:hypothetical protein [Streptomyces sp. NPDC014622]|uniref:hypothetical protein n=1 Tax=Streptomyces sp. NPDC014622 TaxID=3364874 RepID=UPI0037034B4D
MSDKQYEDADSIMSSIESQMAIMSLAKRGEYAAGIAILSGEILKEALAAGVPYSLAQEMASDFWKAEMLADTIAGLLRDSDLGEDEE